MKLYLTLLVLIAYSNSFDTTWALDDFPNILNNFPIHINSFLPEALKGSFFAKPFTEGNLYRPVSNFSFALNWYFCGNNPIGFHIVNIFIHICTTIILFSSSTLLLQTARVEPTIQKNAREIALLASIFWAINPIQTQAVTYIVQRMASMAAMFFILSLYSYIKARHAHRKSERILFFLLSLVTFLLACGCKENGITLIPTILIVEYFFLYKSNGKYSKTALKIWLFLTICFFIAGIYYIISHNLLYYLNQPIGSRPFSIGERLLTQPSILLFYLSLLFFPSPERLTIDHSFPLSTSLWHPWTTLPAIIILFSLIIFALLQGRKKPFLCFAILFFLVNHIVESSFIPLEMIFEHRNYLPSMFLFLPVATGLCSAIEKTRQSKRLIHTALLFSIPVILMTLGLGTYSRNKAWASEESLWIDALHKASTNARPYAKLGEIYGWQKEKNPKNLRTAVTLLEKAILLESPRKSFKAAIVGNIGKIYANYGLLDLAILNYQRSLDINPNFITSRFDLANALALQGRFTEALDQVNKIIAKNDLQSRFFNLKTLLLLWLDRPKEAAIASSQTIRRTMVNKERYFYNCGVSLTRAGSLSQGHWFLRQALKLFPGDRRVLYSLIENRTLANDFTIAKNYASQLVSLHSLPAIKADLETLPKEYSSVPVNVPIITPFIDEATREALTAH
ncbi:hypothetical protein JWJ90_08965 [Desulfobulbus rhabdoformis]|uniref:tetratricopeptide repeat protein n=1 Tax=Desulfobulbus rhabdoformis TaxID=34032 RepID=UPI0019647B1E|nr:tetratricopeptide repeat protein [Desulfobulbus rhabdoformis]MBM9614421.1 hypothetical protein [Desulfobulbus rhabdoformis]